MSNRSMSFWFLQGPGWLLLIYLLYAQGIPAFNYELGVAMGTQESAEKITEVGTAFWWGFALGDLVIYIPLLILGLVGHALGKPWGSTALVAALGITAYWPVVSLAAVSAASDAPGWTLLDTSEYWIVLPLIFLWAAWGLWWMRATATTPTQASLSTLH
jgi:hypothetical protein